MNKWHKHSLPYQNGNCLEEFVTCFQVLWLKLGQTLQQQLVQQKIEETEAQYTGARTKREKRYYTPLGEMVLSRRVYQDDDGYQIKVDQELGLPSDKWLPQVLELACALGVSSEFPNAHKTLPAMDRHRTNRKNIG